MNTKRLALLVIGGLLAWLLVAALFSFAEPDSSYVRDVGTGETRVVYSSDADRDRAEQLATWSLLAQGLVVVVVGGLVVHGTRPGKWLRAEGTSTEVTPSDFQADTP